MCVIGSPVAFARTNVVVQPVQLCSCPATYGSLLVLLHRLLLDLHALMRCCLQKVCLCGVLVLVQHSEPCVINDVVFVLPMLWNIFCADISAFITYIVHQDERVADNLSVFKAFGKDMLRCSKSFTHARKLFMIEGGHTK